MKRSLLAHYLTVAIRSLERYKTQSVISIAGLAVGFVCLALSSVWIRYENTFDNFHPGADRMYMVWDKGLDLGRANLGTVAPRALNSLAIALREEWPEVECATMIDAETNDEKSGWKVPFTMIGADTAFVRVFSLKPIEGELATISYKLSEFNFIVTDEYARKRFGEGSPIGKAFNAFRMPSGDTDAITEAPIKGVVKAWHHSSFAFDALILEDGGAENSKFAPDGGFSMAVVRLRKGASADELERKLNAIDMGTKRIGEISLVPISQAHRLLADIRLHKDNLSYRHLRYFQLVSVLLVVCVFINFLVLFLIRVRGRQREMALRMVHGAKPRMLLAQFVVELSVTLGAALGLGLVMSFVVKDVFAAYAGIDLEGGYILGSALLFMAIIAAVCLLIATVSVEIVRRNTIRRSLMPGGGRRNNTFTKVCTGIQLAVSLALICCSAFMLKQLWFMKNTDWGYGIKGRMHFEALATRNDIVPDAPEWGGHFPFPPEWKESVLRRLNQLPYVSKAAEIGEDPIGLYGRRAGGMTWTMMPGIVDEGDNDKTYEYVRSRGFSVHTFYGFKDLRDPTLGITVLDGALPAPERWTNEVVITERTRQQMGVEKAVGSDIMIAMDDFSNAPDGSLNIVRAPRHYVVAAVVKDFYLSSPSDEPYPCVLMKDGIRLGTDEMISVHFDPAHRADLAKELTAMFDEEPSLIYNTVWHEDEWAELMRSEENLSRLLLVVSIVAVLVAVFGVYSIITLACRQRRKEIALRKIHGAKLRDILGMFVREYGLILAVGAFVAFSVSYIVMHGWLEQYVKRTPLSLWVFVAIFVGTALLIALFVGSRVWRTARENPADVVKSE